MVVFFVLHAVIFDDFGCIFRREAVNLLIQAVTLWFLGCDISGKAVLFLKLKA